MKLLTEQQAAEMIGMSVHWLRKKRGEGGGIEFIKIGNGSRSAVRYEQNTVLRYIDSRRRKSTSDSGC